MSRFIEYYWPIEERGAITSIQNVETVDGIGYFKLDGTYLDPLTGVINIIRHGFARTVEVFCDHDDAGTYTIIGTQNGAVVTDTITINPGGQGGQTSGTKSFDTITSISVNNNVTGVTFGTSNIGYFPIVPVNLEGSKTDISYALQVDYDALGSEGTYQVYTTLKSVVNNGYSYDQMVANLMVTELTPPQDGFPAIIQFNAAYSNILVKLMGDAINGDTEFRLQFLQL